MFCNSLNSCFGCEKISLCKKGGENLTIYEQDAKISELSSEEYFYLTENLECADKKDVEKGVKYLVYNKKRKLLKIVRAAIENELEENEKSIALDYWNGRLSAREIAEKHSIARSTVYRNIDGAKKKLERSLKYVLMYDKASLPGSADELLEFVKKEKTFEA